MIDVDLLWRRVNQDITGLGRSGYESNEEFNRDMNECQYVLLEKHHAMYELNQQSIDSISHLIVSSDIQVVNGIALLPEDYAHKVSVSLLEMKTASSGLVSCPDNSDEYMRIHFSRSHQFEDDVNDPIQGVKSSRIGYYTIEGNSLRIEPKSISGINFRYFKNPTDALRVVTYDVNDAEVYDANSSVQLDWPMSEFPNFVSTLVLIKSVSTRDAEVLAYNNLSQTKPI
jgi:hypothetical protein